MLLLNVRQTYADLPSYVPFTLLGSVGGATSGIRMALGRHAPEIVAGHNPQQSESGL
jgi:hypothetical protein